MDIIIAHDYCCEDGIFGYSESLYLVSGVSNPEHLRCLSTDHHFASSRRLMQFGPSTFDEPASEPSLAPGINVT